MISMLIQIVITAYRNRYDSDAAADIELGTDVGTRSESTESSHWLDKAIPEFGEQNVKDTKAVWRILPVFCALPVFWMLFQQQNNAWYELEIRLILYSKNFVPTANPLIFLQMPPRYNSTETKQMKYYISKISSREPIRSYFIKMPPVIIRRKQKKSQLEI